MSPTRRAFVTSCAAAVALAAAPPAEAKRPRAPRITCSHTGCRYFRRGGRCGLSLVSDAAYPEEMLP